MPQMIRPELPLKPIDRNFALRQRHHTSVIDQQIERNSAPRKCSRKAAYRRQRSHIHFHQLSSCPQCFTLQTLQRSLSLRRIPACQKHLRPMPRQLQRRLVANPAVRASHQCRASAMKPTQMQSGFASQVSDVVDMEASAHDALRSVAWLNEVPRRVLDALSAEAMLHRLPAG